MASDHAEQMPGDRRRAVALAGHLGDESTARQGLADPLPHVRATALGALARMGALTGPEIAVGLTDPAEAVRRRSAELAPRHPGVELVPSLDDAAPAVVEMAAWALGERGGSGCVPALASVARSHPDPLCREAAVAAIGAIAAQATCPPEGLTAILEACGDRPAIRRRAVLALAAFEGSAVTDALRAALSDRDWQVRQAAEDLLAET